MKLTRGFLRAAQSDSLRPTDSERRAGDGSQTRAAEGFAYGDRPSPAGVRDDPRAAKRMLGLANIMDGMGVADASIAVGMERQALGDAVKRYNAEGLDGLYDRAKPGRPRKLDASQEAELAEIVRTGPATRLTASPPTRWKISPGSNTNTSRSPITGGLCRAWSSGSGCRGRKRGPIIPERKRLSRRPLKSP